MEVVSAGTNGDSEESDERDDIVDCAVVELSAYANCLDDGRLETGDTETISG